VLGGPDVAGSGATRGSALNGSVTHPTLESHGAAGKSRTLDTIRTQSALCVGRLWLPWRVLGSTGPVLHSTHFFCGTRVLWRVLW
jgi:hypothetical protein